MKEILVVFSVCAFWALIGAFLMIKFNPEQLAYGQDFWMLSVIFCAGGFATYILGERAEFLENTGRNSIAN